MSRIGILTFLHNGNYGSSLQAYALQRTLQQMGHVCEHIDYQPDTREKIWNMLRCGNSPRLLLEGKKKRQVREAQQGLQEKLQRIQQFYTNRMALSPVCRNRSELRMVAERYDQLLCGSDQIWNPTWLNPAYLLDFADPEKPRFAYAPSLGVSHVPGRRKQRIMRRQMALFDGISVREEEGARVLVSMIGTRPPVVPDPVCLLTAEEWAEVTAPAGETEPYLLCYFIGENQTYWQRVRTMKEKTGLNVRVIPVTAEAYAQKEFQLLDGLGPEAFLGAILGAEMLCTDSFHGLAFGTIFEKKVELIPRDRADARDSKNSRVDHFQREYCQRGLQAMRTDGLNWLEEMLPG